MNVGFLYAWSGPVLLLTILSSVPFFISRWCAKKIEKLIYRRTGRVAVSIVGAILLYLTLFPIFFFICGSMILGVVEAGGDGEGIGLLIVFGGVFFLPIILFLWIGGVLLLIFKDIKTIRASIGVVPQKSWLKFLPIFILLGITSLFCSLFFLMA